MKGIVEIVWTGVVALFFGVLAGRIFVIVLVALLAGCAATCPPPPAPQVRIVDHGCDWIGQVLVHVDAQHDTAETIRDAVALKKAYDKNCHGLPSH